VNASLSSPAREVDANLRAMYQAALIRIKGPHRFRKRFDVRLGLGVFRDVAPARYFAVAQWALCLQNRLIFDRGPRLLLHCILASIALQ
jgi:hypothetical protein